uniref:PsbP C-terminal domain-containing protein n=1 Tax=Pyramimonas obovata TaxID=1411642 RepID=A0A7S0N208_9CHLO
MASTALNIALASPSVRLARQPAATRSRAPQRLTRCAPIRCAATGGDEPQAVMASRRGVLSTALAVSLGCAFEGPALARPANEAGDGAMVANYLPETADGFFKYVVKGDRTPALRAEALEPYSFVLPGDFKELPVANAISGNYCQPRCDEPTTEVKFGSPSAGNVQIIIAPTTKLTRLQSPTIDQIGDLDGVINSIGPYITGDFIDPEDVTSSREINDNGRKYFVYELNTPYALTGTHNLASVTTSKNELVLMVVSTNDKQWNKSSDQLIRVVESFRV